MHPRAVAGIFPGAIPEIRSNPRDTLKYLLLSITSEIIAAEIVGRKGHAKG